MDIGIFNGHLIGIDDANTPAYADLRGFLGVNTLPVVPPLSSFMAGTMPVGLSGVGPITARRLRRCQRDACPERRISKDCRYTPVLQDLTGQYCRGCDQDICLGISPRRGGQGLNALTGGRGRGRGGDRGDRAENKEERKRLRKLRRRVCRSTGMCVGDSRQEVMQGQLRRSLLGRSNGGRNGARSLLAGQNPLGVVAGLPQVGVMGGVPRVPGIVGGLPQVGVIGPGPQMLGGVPPVGIVGGPQVGIVPPVGVGQGPIIGGLLGNILGNAGMQGIAG